LTDNTKIKENEYNIQNPLTESEVPSKIEVVLYRYWLTTNKAIGAMARFYDRFFKNAQKP
jgi:hypothetical protein